MKIEIDLIDYKPMTEAEFQKNFRGLNLFDPIKIEVTPEFHVFKNLKDGKDESTLIRKVEGKTTRYYSYFYKEEKECLALTEE